MSVSAPARRAPFVELVRHRELSNGARFYVLENHFNPTVAISGSLTAGRLFAPADRRLIASVTAGELMKGTARRTKLQLAEDLESRAVSLGVFLRRVRPRRRRRLGGRALPRDRRAARGARRRSFSLRRSPRTSSSGKRSASSARSASNRTRPPSGPTSGRCAGCTRWRTRCTPSAARSGSRASRRCPARTSPRSTPTRYGAGSLALVVVGDVEAERILDRLEALLGAWPAGPKPEIPPVSVPPPSPGRETVEMPDKASADVVVAVPANLKRTDPDFYACTLANAALGQSSLTSRLGVRVRDTEGLTYGIHSSFSATHVAGPFTIGLTVKPESRDAALVATLEEVGKLLEGRAHGEGARRGKELPDRAVQGRPRLELRDRQRARLRGLLRLRCFVPRRVPVDGRRRHEGGGRRRLRGAGPSGGLHDRVGGDLRKIGLSSR